MKPQQICDSPCESNGWECPDLRNLRAALDAERQAHAETRAEMAHLAEQLGDVACCHCAVELGPGSDNSSCVWCNDCAAGDTATDLERVNEELRECRLLLSEARDEVVRLAETVARDLERLGPLRTERDEARRDAVEAVRLSGLSPRDLGADMADRIDGYRSATAPPKPAPPPARASRR